MTASGTASGFVAAALRRPVRICAAGLVLAVLAGLGGLLIAPGPHPVRDLFGDLVALVLGRLPARFDLAEPPLLIALAALALPVMAIALALALVRAGLGAALRRRLIRARGDHLVIAGDGPLAEAAAQHEVDRGGAVLLWHDDAHAGGVRRARAQSAARVPLGDAARSVTALGLGTARAMLVLGDDGQRNVALTTVVLDAVSRSRPGGDPLAVMVQIDDPVQRRDLEAAAARTGQALARLRFVAPDDLAARHLFCEWPLDRFRRLGQSGRLVIAFGLSPLIARYVLRVLAGNHFRDGVRPRFIVIAPDADALAAAFRARHPGADALSPVAFEHCDPSDPAKAFARIAQREGDPVAVVIDPGDGTRAEDLAAMVDAHYRAADRATPVLHLRGEGTAPSPTCPMIHRFGGADQWADPDFLMLERTDALARSIHEFYLEGRLAEGDRIGARASMQEWDDLGEQFRDDNRLVADCYRLKLRDIGARIMTDPGPPFRLEPDELEELARAEHDRWMAAKLSDGWIHGTLRDDHLRRHPDIVPYDALTEPVKDLDREQVRVMTRLLATGGLRALRVLTVAIDPSAGEGATGDAIVEAMAQILPAIAAQWPDRVPIFAGSLAHAAARRAMTPLAGPICLIVPGHAGRLIDALPVDQHDSASALLARADTIMAIGPGDDPRAAVLAGADLVITDANRAPAPCPAIILRPDGRILSAPWL